MLTRQPNPLDVRLAQPGKTLFPSREIASLTYAPERFKHPPKPGHTCAFTALRNLYHISGNVSETPLVEVGVALFIHLAELDVSEMTFPEWLSEVSSFDVSNYQRQQTALEEKEHAQ